MMTRNLPEIVRIKRKRNQDSLQALILEAPRNKRIKDAAYVFKLQRTDIEIVKLPTDGETMLPLLQESSHKDDKNNTYVIPKEQSTEELPEEFNEMLDSFLTMGPQTGEFKQLKKRKRRVSSAGTSKTTVSEVEAIDLEYVYDVYYRDKAVAESWEKDKIGYIKFEEDYDNGPGDDESDEHISDDEDSNAEDFYKNDYPEDEDDHTTEANDSDEEFQKLTESLHKEAAARSPKVSAESGLEDLFDEYCCDRTDGDFLEALNKEVVLDDEDEDEDDLMDPDVTSDDDYPRQNFFADDEDDELAKHRDRIFGKLQRMINEEN